MLSGYWLWSVDPSKSGTRAATCYGCWRSALAFDSHDGHQQGCGLLMPPFDDDFDFFEENSD